jgi:hypothetical protein
MNVFFAEFGKKLADAWLSALVLPGLLMAGVVWAALALRQSHSLDSRALASSAKQLAATFHAHGTGAIVIALAAALLVAAGFGLVAQFLGGIVQRCWLGNWPRWAQPATRRLTSRRRTRWEGARDDYDTAARRALECPDDAARQDVDRLAGALNRVALAPPSRPTWMGDRAVAAAVRVDAGYGLDLSFCWPRLWLVIPEAARTELTAARDQFGAATTLTAWGILYAIVGVIWWPAAIIGLVTAAVGWYRGRATIAAFADLVEATVDIYARDLATSLGMPVADGPITFDVGRKLTEWFRKGA